MRALVVLNPHTRVAIVTLSGIPLGGALEGMAWLDASGRPKLDVDLHKALSQRGVGVEAVTLDDGWWTCTVTTSLPLLRTLRITLTRDTSEEE